MTSKDPEFERMRKHGIKVYPEVFKKADLIKIMPDVIVKELKKSTNVNFEKDTYDEIRDIITTIVHNHMNTSSPMDVDKKIMSLSTDNNNSEAPDNEQRSQASESEHDHQWPLMDEEGGIICYIGKNGQGEFQTKGKGKGKGKGKFQGECFNCGKFGHRSNECWSKGKSKGKGEYKGRSEYQWGHKGKGDYKGKGKGINTFEYQPFVPQPQQIAQQAQAIQQQEIPNMLMANSWENYSGNFGGLNLNCLNKSSGVMLVNKFKALAEDDHECQARNEYTIGDAINTAFKKASEGVKDNNMNNKAKRGKTKVEKKKVKFIDDYCKHKCAENCKSCDMSMKEEVKDQNSEDNEATGRVNEEPASPWKPEVLACLIKESGQIESRCNQLCSNTHDEYEKISIMIDSGASETVASLDKFPMYKSAMTTATGTTYASAADKQSGDIVNIGEKVVETIDEHGITSHVKFQMCKGLGEGKILGSVSRMVQSGHTVVFQNPEWGSYIQNNVNKYKTYLRQEHGSYYLDLWVRKTPFQWQGK